VWVQFSTATVNGRLRIRWPATPHCSSTSTIALGVVCRSGLAGQRVVVVAVNGRALPRASQIIRILTREDEAQLDQIVLSPARYLSSQTGPVQNDNTIVAK
jgi:hypothetical protein